MNTPYLDRIAGVVLAQTGSAVEQVVLDGPVTLGRGENCDVILPGPKVSREHARIRTDGASWLIEDLGSRNGISLDGVRIEQPTRLTAGAVIAICDAQLRFVAHGEFTIVSTLPFQDATRVCATLAPERALEALLEVLRELRGAVDVPTLNGRVLDGVLRLFPSADRAILATADDSGGLVDAAERRRPGRSARTGPISRTLLELACTRGEAILGQEEGGVDPILSLAERAVQSAMCVPLLARSGEVLGAIAVETFRNETPFSPKALSVLSTIGTAAAYAVESARDHARELISDRMNRDLEHARVLQRQFLPSRPPRCAGYRFDAWYEPATAVGGDYYDFIQLGQGRIGVAIGDVSGKGLPAALLMARVSSDVRYALTAHADPGRVLAAVNETLVTSGVSAHFVTMVIAVLDPSANMVDIAVAGHPPPLLVRDGVVRAVGGEVAGRPLNIEAVDRYECAHIPIPLGSTLVLYTDGVPDTVAPDGRRLGDAPVHEAVAAPAANIVESLRTTVEEFRSTREPVDDATVVLFERESPPHECITT